MTGEEFYNKVQAIKTITDIHWHTVEDDMDTYLVKVVIIADCEEIKITYPNHGDITNHFMQNASMALIINKFMELIGDDFRTCFASDLSEAINYSRKQIEKMKGGN